MTKILIIALVFISTIFSQNNGKIVLKSEIQEYLFSIQRIQHDFIKLEDEVFNQKSNSRTSKALEMTEKMFLKNKNDVYLFDDNPNLKINKSIKKKTLNFKKLLKTKLTKKLAQRQENSHRKVV